VPAAKIDGHKSRFDLEGKIKKYSSLESHYVIMTREMNLEHENEISKVICTRLASWSFHASRSDFEELFNWISP
jgi:hypothetical protein